LRHSGKGDAEPGNRATSFGHDHMPHRRSLRPFTTSQGAAGRRAGTPFAMSALQHPVNSSLRRPREIEPPVVPPSRRNTANVDLRPADFASRQTTIPPPLISQKKCPHQHVRGARNVDARCRASYSRYIPWAQICEGLRRRSVWHLLPLPRHTPGPPVPWSSRLRRNARRAGRSWLRPNDTERAPPRRHSNSPTEARCCSGSGAPSFVAFW
jgi:hypothetical protein